MIGSKHQRQCQTSTIVSDVDSIQISVPIQLKQWDMSVRFIIHTHTHTHTVKGIGSRIMIHIHALPGGILSPVGRVRNRHSPSHWICIGKVFSRSSKYVLHIIYGDGEIWIK